MISDAIHALRDLYLFQGQVSSYRQINCGLCVEFAEQIEEMIPSAEQMSNDFFVEDIDEGWNGDGSDKWDAELLASVRSIPQTPYSLEIANQIEGYHRWILLDGLHYDAECPEGVKNFFDLPFFKRWLDSIQERNLNL